MRALLLLLSLFPIFLLAQNQPNIVWFVSEDNSPYLKAYGDTLVHTPTLDAFTQKSVTYTNAFSNAPVCAPSRSTMITGMYPPTMGTQHMRAEVDIDESIQFFPKYLKEAGYFTTLRLKRDYNTPKQAGTWDVDDWWHAEDAFKGRKDNQPYFLFYNTWMTHEGKLHDHSKKFDYFRSTFSDLSDDVIDSLIATIQPISPDEVSVPPYLPDLPEVRKDLALYYELMQMLDVEFALFLEDLKQQGELDNTIIIYSSDHGGVLGRSKRFALESGLKVPLMIHFPETYKHLAPAEAGGQTDRLVSFVDFAPTLLALAGIEKPEHMQGDVFLTDAATKEPAYAFGFRDRMDESYDLVRTIRDKEFRYIRNFNPHRPHGQRVNYLWKSANVRAWETSFLNSELNDTQAVFFQPKVAEELYQIESDPHCVHNLVGDPEYQAILSTMRGDLSHFIREIKDVGFIPEGELYAARTEEDLLYQNYVAALPLTDIITAAEQATRLPTQKKLKKYMQHEQASIRFWGATGTLILQQKGTKLTRATQKKLKKLLDDPSGDVQAIAAEVLYPTKARTSAISTLERLLQHKNPYVVLRTLNAMEARQITAPELLKQVEEIAQRDEKGKYSYATRKAQYLIGAL
jgi:arylsulfatase A-like enzyme